MNEGGTRVSHVRIEVAGARAGEKRQEFLESLTALTAEEGGFCRKLFLKDVTDETVYCWMGDCDSAEELEAFMNSDTFRAVRGAAKVLGILEDVSIVEMGPAFSEKDSVQI